MWADYSLSMERDTHELRFSGGEEGDKVQWLIGVFGNHFGKPIQYALQ